MRCVPGLIFACVAVNASAQNAAAPCAETASALAPQSYAMNAGADHRKPRSAEYVLDTHGGCLQPADAMAVPALLIRLDPSTQTTALKLTSVSDKESTLPSRIAVLDESFAEQKSYPFDRFVKRGLDYTATLFLGPSSTVRYLLATPDAEWVGRKNQSTSGHRWTTLWAAGTVFGTFSNGTERRTAVPFAVFGKLRLEVEDDDRVIAAPSH